MIQSGLPSPGKAPPVTSVLRSTLAAALVALSASARADASAAPGEPPAERPATLFGLSAGAGDGVMDYVRFDTPFSHERGGGLAIGLHAARVLDREFALGLRGLVWQRAFNNDEGDDETWAFTLGAVVLTWRPGGGGLFVRAGPGWGRAEVELDYGASKAVGADSGPAAVAACGWTWRLGGGVELGPAVEWGAVRLEDDWRADLRSLALEATWRP